MFPNFRFIPAFRFCTQIPSWVPTDFGAFLVGHKFISRVNFNLHRIFLSQIFMTTWSRQGEFLIIFEIALFHTVCIFIYRWTSNNNSVLMYITGVASPKDISYIIQFHSTNLFLSSNAASWTTCFRQKIL